MIISFFGHAHFRTSETYEQTLLPFLEKPVGDGPAELYLGGYGEFDSFAHACCKKYKHTHPHVSLVLVTPYITLSYQKNHLEYQKDL